MKINGEIKIKTNLIILLFVSFLLRNSYGQDNAKSCMPVTASSVKILDLYNQSLNAMEAGNTRFNFL